MPADVPQIACHRFGLGGTPGPSDTPEGVLEQLTPEAHPPRGLARRGELGARLQELMAVPGPQRRRHARTLLEEDRVAREQDAVRSTRPAFERWVAFWSNRLTVSATQRRTMAGLLFYERDAIRPNVLGPFSELLRAAVQHPAMLVYLDNVRSVGPHSIAGQRREVGLNENLARELLELHTLGVHGGYDQDDVVQTARVLTGWSVDRPHGTFTFRGRAHEPGSKRVLGRTWPEGLDGGTALLDWLAVQPQTARHHCTALARHYLSDDPPVDVIEALVEVWLSTDGHLGEVARTLARHPRAWQAPLQKVKTPRELVLSTARLLGHRRGAALVRAQQALGQQPLEAPSPQGWPDEAAAWATPAAVLGRLEWLERAAVRYPLPSPLQSAETLFGPWLSRRTRRALEGADPLRGTALLLASPEHQRR